MERPARPLVVYGSSTVRLWQEPQRDLHRPDVLAVGFGGARLGDLQQHYDRLVAPLQPAMLVIAAGANDLADAAVTAAQVAGRVASLVQWARLRSGLLPVLVLTLKPSPELDAQINRILAANAALAGALSGSDVRLVDTCTPFLTRAARADPRYYTTDRRHMNAAGYDRWSACLAAALPEHSLHP